VKEIQEPPTVTDTDEEIRINGGYARHTFHILHDYSNYWSSDTTKARLFFHLGKFLSCFTCFVSRTRRNVPCICELWSLRTRTKEPIIIKWAFWPQKSRFLQRYINFL